MDFSTLDLKWVAELFHKENNGTIRHNHTFFQILYVRSGSGRVYINNQEIPLVPFSFCLFKPLDFHEFYGNEGGMSVYEMKFDIADPMLHERLSSLDNLITVDPTYLEHVFGSLVFENDRNDELSELVQRSLFTELTVHLFRSQEKENTAVTSGMPNPLLKVIKYIDKHYREDIALDDLADIMHVEKTYFIRIFKRHIGVTPMHYLQTLKIEKAAALIQNSDMNITGISEFLGFKSIHHFSNTFKKHTGVSPTDYKENARSRANQSQ